MDVRLANTCNGDGGIHCLQGHGRTVNGNQQAAEHASHTAQPKRGAACSCAASGVDGTHAAHDRARGLSTVLLLEKQEEGNGVGMGHRRRPFLAKWAERRHGSLWLVEAVLRGRWIGPALGCDAASARLHAQVAEHFPQVELDVFTHLRNGHVVRAAFERVLRASADLVELSGTPIHTMSAVVSPIAWLSRSGCTSGLVYTSEAAAAYDPKAVLNFR